MRGMSILRMWRVVAAGLCCLAVAAHAAERGADGNFETRRSSHFLLQQDVAIDGYTGAHGSRRFEQDVLEVLEQAWQEVNDSLGITPRGRTRVVVYDAGIYDAEFARRFGFRSAGFFDGVVHVRAGVAVDAPLAMTLQHEYVHAALEGLDLPAWLSEGLAEYFERPPGSRGPTAGELAMLRRVAASGSWIPVEQLSGSNFAGFDQDRANLAYLQSLALVSHLAGLRGERALGRLCRDLSRTRLERALQRQFGLSVAELEQAVVGALSGA
jgi:hypothetical protein